MRVHDSALATAEQMQRKKRSSVVCHGRLSLQQARGRAVMLVHHTYSPMHRGLTGTRQQTRAPPGTSIRLHDVTHTHTHTQTSPAVSDDCCIAQRRQAVGRRLPHGGPGTPGGTCARAHAGPRPDAQAHVEAVPMRPRPAALGPGGAGPPPRPTVGGGAHTARPFHRPPAAGPRPRSTATDRLRLGPRPTRTAA